MTTKIDVALLRKAIRVGPPSRVARLLTRLTPETLAPLLADLSPAELKTVIRLLLSDGDLLANTLTAIPQALLPQVLRSLDLPVLAQVLDRLDPDDAVYLAQHLDDDRRGPALELTSPERGRLVTRLLGYSEGSAGRRMIPRFVAVRAESHVGEAIAAIRRAGKDVPIFYLYIVDEQKKLLGVASLSQLVKAEDDVLLRDIMTTDLVSVAPEADQEEVARLVSRRHLLALPVLGDGGELLGLVTIDDVLDVLEQEATEDMYRVAGLSQGDRVFSPPLRSLFKRLPWNALNLLTSLLAATVVSLFEDTILRILALATFLPVVAGIGGNTGNQTLTVVIRGLTLGEISFSSAWRAVLKEVLVALGIGLILGSTVGTVAYLWKGTFMLGVVLFLAMIANLLVGALAATSIPLTLKRLGLDPALGSSILVTLCTDVFGFLSFLGLATLLMQDGR